MRRLKLIIVSLVAILGIGLVFVPETAYAADCTKDPMGAGCPCEGALDSSGNLKPDKPSICADLGLKIDKAEEKVTNTSQNIINLLIFACGIVAVVAIIISGMRFSTAHGDSSAVTKARTSLIYSVVGLIIAVFAFAIVNFIFSRLGESNSGGGGGGTPPCPTGQHEDPVTNLCIPDTP
jgi:lysylphosphatidylglycerol synthetase-like protein (DUF2156 family)